MARRGDSEFLRQMKEELRNLQQQRRRIQAMEGDQDLVQDIAEMTWDDDLAKVRNLVRGSLEQVEKTIQEGITVTRKASSPLKRPNLPDLVPGTIQKTERSLPEAPSESRDRLLRTVMTKLQESAQSRLSDALREKAIHPQLTRYPLNTGFYEYQYAGLNGPKDLSLASVDQKLKKLSRAALPAVSVAAANEIRTRSCVLQDTGTQPEESTLRMDEIADVVGEILQEEMNQWIGDFQVPVLRNLNQDPSSPRRNPSPFNTQSYIKSAQDVAIQARPDASEAITQTNNRTFRKDIAIETLQHEAATHATQTSAEEEPSTPEEWYPFNLTEDRGVNTRPVTSLSPGTQYEKANTPDDEEYGRPGDDEILDDEPLSEPRTLRVQPEPPVNIAAYFSQRSRLSSLSLEAEDIAAVEAPTEEPFAQNTSESHSSGLTSTQRDLSPGQIKRFPDSMIDTTFSISEGEVLFYPQFPRLPLDGASEGEVSEGQWSSAELNRTYTAGSSNPVAQTFSAGEIRFADVSTAEDLTTEFDTTLAN